MDKRAGGRPCDYCGGSGFIMVPKLIRGVRTRVRETCQKCKGSGKIR